MTVGLARCRRTALANSFRWARDRAEIVGAVDLSSTARFFLSLSALPFAIKSWQAGAAAIVVEIIVIGLRDARMSGNQSAAAKRDDAPEVASIPEMGRAVYRAAVDVLTCPDVTL